jgi:hypothetical protein
VISLAVSSQAEDLVAQHGAGLSGLRVSSIAGYMPDLTEAGKALPYRHDGFNPE